MLQLACSKVMVTPDARGAVGFLPVPAPEPPRDDLYARLFLLDTDGERVLIVALDYGGLYLSVLEEWKKRLADAIGISENRVVLHCEHQHDAPFINIEAAQIIAPQSNWEWLEPIARRLEQAAAKLVGQLTRIARLGWSETRLHGYASNRRVLMPDGSIAVRYSRCAAPEIRNQPVGVVDPMLRTLGFYDIDNHLIAAWNFYATHPQVGNAGRRYSADAPGEAMRLLETQFPGTINAFFNGCFGNLTAGKYTSMTDLEGNIRHFGKLLADGIARNLGAPEFSDPLACGWREKGFGFPARHFSEAELQLRAQHNPLISAALRAGMSWAGQHQEIFNIAMLTLGPIRILFMDGELFIEYQLFCQNLIPDEKIAVVGNCGGNFYYIGTADALREPAGYETTSFCRVRPEFEALFQRAVRNLLIEN